MLCGPGDYGLVPYQGSWNQETEAHFRALSPLFCRRKEGVGAQALGILQRVLPHSNGPNPPELRFFATKGRAAKEPLDLKLCAAKYLFDSGTFSSGSVTVTTSEGREEIQAVDSSHFRLGLSLPRAQGQDLDPSRGLLSLQVSSGGQQIPVLPVESAQRASVILESSDHPPGLLKSWGKKWNADPSTHRLPLMASLLARDRLALRLPESDHVDFTEAAVLAACATGVQSLTDEEVLVTIGDHGFFVEIDWKAGQVWVTAPIRYVYSGTFSWTGPESAL